MKAVYFPISMIGYYFARWLHKRQQDQIQSERNSRANELADLLLVIRDHTRVEPIPPYVLYLRPFATTGHLPFPFAREDRTISDYWLYGTKFDFESFLGKASREGLPSWNVYAIGGLGGGIGADKISARDDEWKELFGLLASQAYALAVCPFDRPGTRWEIDEIISNPELLGKTIFVLPPARRLWRRDLAASWEQTRQRLRDKVPAFPQYRRGCVVFALRPKDLAVLELQRGPLSIKLFKSVVLGMHASADIERLWNEAPKEVKAELPRLFRKMGTGLEAGMHHPGLVATQPVQGSDHMFITEKGQVALEWLVNNCLVLVDGPYAISTSALLRLHPAVLTWSRAQAWLAGANSVAQDELPST